MITVKPHKINLILAIILLLLITCLTCVVIHNKAMNPVFTIIAVILFIIAIALLLTFFNKKLIFHGEEIIIYSMLRTKLSIKWKDVTKIEIQSEKEMLTERPRVGKTAVVYFGKRKVRVPSYYYGYPEMIRFAYSNYKYKMKYIDKIIPVIRLFRQ